MLWFGLACIAGFGLTSRAEDQAGELVVGLIGKACFGLAVGCTSAWNLSSGIQPNLILLDFKKAFDKVPHHHLLQTLLLKY